MKTKVLRTTFTRNQIAKRQAEITKRLTEIYEYSRQLNGSTREPVRSDVSLEEFRNRVERETVESESLRKELEELSTLWLESRDEDEPDQEIYIPTGLSAPLPLLVLLHGAGWTGGSQIEPLSAVRSGALNFALQTAERYTNPSEISWQTLCCPLSGFVVRLAADGLFAAGYRAYP